MMQDTRQEKGLYDRAVGASWVVFYNDTQTFVSQHWHAHLEILHLIQGQCRLFLDQQAYDLESGDLMVISAGSSHSIPDLSGCTFRVIQFTSDFIHSGITGSEWRHLLPFLQPDTSCLARCQLSDKDILLDILLAIEIDDREKEPGYELSIKGNLYRLFAQLIRHGAIVYPGDRQIRALLEKLQPAINYVASEYAQPIRADQAAAICYMSYHHFCRSFHQVTGKTFMAFLHHVRLQKARELMVSSDLAITLIARKTGFASASHFAAVFRKSNNMTPSKWRQLNTSVVISK